MVAVQSGEWKGVISGMTRVQIERKLAKINERLEYYYEKEKALLTESGVQSYTIGSRSVSRYQYSANIQSQIDKLETERDSLENLLEGNRARKAVAIVPRDW
ncbi:MAG: hypothetical protein NC434_14040 [Ruminococcus sp.]|nr:hypothetical protein [Ruminococcus sp.]